jgi:hypothetical protein
MSNTKTQRSNGFAKAKTIKNTSQEDENYE